MSATLVYIGIGSGLAIGIALLVVAILFLRTARRYVDLAEERLELLRESEALLLRVVRQQGQDSEESWQREPGRRERIPEVVGQPLGQRAGEESSGNFPSPEGADRNVREAPGRGAQVSSAEDGEQRREGAPKAGAPGAAAPRPKDGAPLLGVKVPHPDDDVTPRGRSGSVANFFQRKYDLYLDQYERHVRLAERIHRMRDEAYGSLRTPRTQEWEDKLRRAYDAIDRTTQRLDLLEHHYPELATDGGRLSDRLDLSRLQAELTERSGRSG
ncbi:MAG: hypothetical protein AVDCRST_MAG01-01-1874 [uncultured Rubrobacteraceae bacterium]|uniref:Uncharacterized protein n=1 Tax=uncultured Rubrobacteraceae bacterium TaxID=349277 RepID=A0A6J4PI68_9ACTN|nr:MAG: hypothetical protein AVDCRST_MAG01-01-1874 [uncultured Rubrobacteraceae bacterium]